jgi:hypothetical protein
METPDKFLTYFKEGTLHEDAVISSLMDEGYEIRDKQQLVMVDLGDGLVVEGHVDGMVMSPMYKEERVLEVKTVSQDIWDEFEKKRWDIGGLFDKYKWQLSVYMIATGKEALVVIKNRNTGQLRFEGVELPFHPLSEIEARVLEVERWVGLDRLPEICDWVQYPCPFFYLHQEEAADVGDLNIEQVKLAAAQFLAAKQNRELAEGVEKIAREELVKSLGKVDKVNQDGLSITYYDYTSTSYKKAMMEADGVLEKYTTKSMSKRLRVKLEEESDGTTDGE